MDDHDQAIDKLLDSLALQMTDQGFEEFKSSGTRNSSGQSMPCIRRVPVEIRQLKESAYIPSIVSIGPLHGKPDDQKAEWIEKKKKVFYTRFLLERVGGYVGVEKISEINQECVKAMLEKEADARGYYTDEDTKWLGKIEFAEMMMIDGCFIIELLYRHYRDEYDPILTDDSKNNRLRNDLTLLQNQIPFSVLEKLFNLTVGRIPKHAQKESDHLSLTKCVLLFLGNRMGLEDPIIMDKRKPTVGLQKTEIKAARAYHIVHLLHIHHVDSQATECSVPISSEEAGQSKSEEGCKSATQLDSNGLKLEANSTGYLFDVKFTTPCCLSQLWRRCSLQIPSFIIDDSTETFLRNMIAFEQCCPGISRYFTSHAFLMDQLINSADDVKLLEDAGIIRTNYLGCREEIDRLFNSICKNVHLDSNGSKFQRQFTEVKSYCDRYWPNRRQKLSRDYCGSPWARISVLAALILFALTLLQTIYAMLSYY